MTDIISREAVINELREAYVSWYSDPKVREVLIHLAGKVKELPDWPGSHPHKVKEENHAVRGRKRADSSKGNASGGDAGK
jgi:hypothetical protein